MATARIFKSGNSQAVRLPREFRMNGPEVEIFKRGDEIVLREKRQGLTELLELFAQLPEEIEQRDQPPMQEREEW
jgi:antitoxin VapB